MIQQCDACRRPFDPTAPGARFPGGTDITLCPECALKEPFEVKT